ncbi:GPI inositol deacylase, partial [Haplosporangium bisporale]
DFNEEFTAFHGKSLWDQARYVNEAIAYILSLYSDDRSTTRPTSILLIGHSMGGIVARTIFTLDNFQHGSVDTIVTVATPHAVPPVALDYEATHIYDIITSFWTRGHTGEGAALKNVTLISIMGGTLDTTVSGDAANIHSIVPQSHGFTVFTSNIPHAWVGCDHLSILWCNQVASAIGQTLVQVADAHYSEGGASVAERMAIFRRRLLTGAEKNGPEDIQMIDLDDIPHTFVGTKGSWAFPPTDDSSRSESIVPHLFLLQLSNLRLQGHDTVTMLTDHGLGQHSRLDLLLCKKAVEENLNRKSLLCSGSNLPVFPVPASTEASSIPLFTGEYFTAREFQSMSLSLDEVADYQYLAVLDRGRRFSDAGFLVAQPVNISATIKTVESSLLAKSRFSTIMKQSSWNMHEDRYFVNIDAKSSININFHGDSPYYTKMSQPGKRGIELLFWTDPSCSELLSLNLRIDVYGSLGRVLIRYRMVVLVFTYMVVIITIQSQFRNWIQGDAFKSFGATLCQLTVTRFWKVSAVLAVIAFVQSLQAKAFVELGSSDQQEDDSWLFKTGIIWRDMLLGGNATFFWFLAPVFYQMAVGITVLIWFVLNTLVGLLAGALALAMRSNMAQDSGVPMPQKHIKSIAISTIVQFALVAAIVPHHFAFVMTILRIVFLCAKELNIAKEL